MRARIKQLEELLQDSEQKVSWQLMFCFSSYWRSPGRGYKEVASCPIWL